jgi:hypothetical protein
MKVRFRTWHSKHPRAATSAGRPVRPLPSCLDAPPASARRPVASTCRLTAIDRLRLARRRPGPPPLSSVPLGPRLPLEVPPPPARPASTA